MEVFSMSIAEKALEALRGGSKVAGTGTGAKQICFESAFKQAAEEINKKYISGTISYARENHPDLWQQIIEAEDRSSDAWLAGVEEGFQKALEEWRTLILQGIDIFRGNGEQRTLF